METFIGTKEITAKPMKRIDYNNYRGWECPKDENPLDDGYLVESLGEPSNHPDHKGYISWSPKEQFEKAYAEPITYAPVNHSDYPHEQRVIDEAKELAVKINNLDLFIIANPLFLNLPEDEQQRLRSQFLVMRHYYSILMYRIDHFKLTNPDKLMTEGGPTLGQKRVQRNFNPSAKKEVEEFKQKYADMIDILEASRNSTNGIEVSIAQTDTETACMYAVKSLFV